MKSCIHHIFIVVLLFISCSDKGSNLDGACDRGQELIIEEVHVLSPWVQSTGTLESNTNYYFYPAGTGNVQFFIGIPQTNICTKEHLDINFKVITAITGASPIPMKFFGEAYWLGFSDEIIFFNGVPAANKEYTGKLNVGLKQAFPDKPGEVDFYVTVEFTSQGSISKDIEFFRKYILSLRIDYTYDKHS